MEDLILSQENLPANIQDLHKFILVGREKLNSVRAEIKAITKLQLAAEVRKQKQNEAKLLSELLIDAEVKFGELSMKLPKKQGFAGNPTNIRKGLDNKTIIQDSADQDYKKDIISCTDATYYKEDILNDLGIEKTSAYRYEQLAKNKELVEQAKEEAREKGEIVSRAKVIDFIKAKEKKIDSYIDECKKTGQEIQKAVYALANIEITAEKLRMYQELLTSEMIIEMLEIIANNKKKLNDIEISLMRCKNEQTGFA